MSSITNAKVGDQVTLLGVDGGLVAVDRYRSPALNWAICEVKLRGQEDHRWLVTVKGKLYEVDLSTPTGADAATGLTESGYVLRREGEAQRELQTASGHEFSRCSFAFYTADDATICIVIANGSGERIARCTPLDSALVEFFPA